MKLLRIEIRNFKPFKELLLPNNGDEIPDGLILIRGPNSTGKSSLFEAILWGLWGSDALTQTTNDEVVSFTSTHCTVILEFRVAGTEYKIHREYNSADGPSVVLFTRQKKAWKRIADKSQSVKSKVDEILNLDRTQAFQTLLVKQGAVSEIATATPVSLRKLLEDVYDIGLLGQMENHLESMERDISLKLDALNRDFERPETIRRQIEEYQGRVDELQTTISETESEIESTQKMLADLPSEKNIDAIAQAEVDTQRAKRDIERVQEGMKNDLSKAGFLDVDESLIESRLESLKKVQERADSDRKEVSEQIKDIDVQTGQLAGASKGLQEHIEHLKGVHADSESEMICPTCSKPLTTAERDRLLEEYESQVSENKKKIAKLKKERNRLEGELDTIEKKRSQAVASEQATNRVNERFQELRAAEEALTEAEDSLASSLSEAGVKNLESLYEDYSLKSITDLKTQRAKLDTVMNNLRSSKGENEARLAREKELLLNLEGKEDLMKRMKTDIEELQKLDAHAKYVRRKLVSGFVADYVFQKRLIGIVKSATNQYVRHFTNSQYTSVDLEPVGGRGRSGSGLLLKIWDERDKAWKKATQLSFGDRTAISLGLRLGISRTMSSIRPLKDSPARMPRVRCVLLDEPLGGLDRSRREAVVSKLTNDQSFEQILLITHTDIQGWEGVPVIEVSKDGLSSTATLSPEA